MVSETRRRKYQTKQNILIPKLQAAKNLPLTKKDNPVSNMKEIYQQVQSIPSFSAKIKEFLRTNYLHSVHKRIVKKKFPRRKVITRFPFELFMADLIEYPSDKYVNNGYCYIWY